MSITTTSPTSITRSETSWCGLAPFGPEPTMTNAASACPSSTIAAAMSAPACASVRPALRNSAIRACTRSIIAGGKLYVMGCMGRHGDPGKPYTEDHANFPPVPQLPHVGTRYSEPEIYWIIKHGIRMTAMSAYGPFYKEDELWSLAAFIRRINTLTPAELQAIQPQKH